jgi:hypothetical protein
MINFFAVLLIPITGCAPKISSHLLNPYEHPHPSCLPENNIVALGFSTESAQLSQHNAHAGIAEQLQSQISSFVTKRNEIIQKQDDEYIQVILSQEHTVVSNFEHNHLIIDVGVPELGGNGYYSLACLPITTTVKQIASEVMEEMDTFELLYQESIAAQDAVSFAHKRRKLWQISKELQPTFVILHSLLSEPSPQELQIRSRLKTIEDKASHLRKDGFALNGDVSGDYLQFIQKTMEEQGLLVTIQETCEQHRYVITITFKQAESKGPMGGQVNDLDIFADIQDCISGEHWNISLGSFSGYHSSEAEIARNDAFQQSIQDQLPKNIRDMFPVIIPID